jgi:hypothetical protein
MENIKKLKRQILISLARGNDDIEDVINSLIDIADILDNDRVLGSEIRILTDELRNIVR